MESVSSNAFQNRGLCIKNLRSLVHFFGARGRHYRKLSSEFEKPMESRDIFMSMYFVDLRVGYERSFFVISPRELNQTSNISNSKRLLSLLLSENQ